MQRRTLVTALAALPALARAQAEWAPDRPIRMIVPFAAGGSTDITARLVAAALTQRLGQSVVVENRPGAGGNIGAEAAARAAPDGYTLLLTTSSTHATNPALYRNLPYDVLRDFAPLSQVAFVPNLLVVRPDLPARTLAELVALARARPGTVTCGTSGPGTSHHLSMALLAARTDAQLVFVPYRGGAPATADLIARKIDMLAGPLIEVIGPVQGGQLRALAVTTARRSPLLPEVPTVGETVPGYEVALWNGVLAPAGTPAPVVARLSREIMAAVRSPEVADRLMAGGSVPVGSTAEEFATFIRAELPRWAELVRISGATQE